MHNAQPELQGNRRPSVHHHLYKHCDLSPSVNLAKCCKRKFKTYKVQQVETSDESENHVFA